MLEIRNLHVSIDDKEILNGLSLTVTDGEVAAIMGPNGSGKSTLCLRHRRQGRLRGPDGEMLLDGRTSRLEPDERAAAGVFLAFQYPLEIPGVATMTFLKAALNAQRKARGEAELTTPDFMKRVRGRGQACISAGHAASARSMSASPAARRSAWRSCRWRCWSRASASSTRPIRASTSTRCKIVADGVNALRSPDRAVPRHHPLPAPAELHRARHRACDVERAGSSSRAARNWRSSSKPTAMPTTARRRPEGIMADITPIRDRAPKPR